VSEVLVGGKETKPVKSNLLKLVAIGAFAIPLLAPTAARAAPAATTANRWAGTPSTVTTMAPAEAGTTTAASTITCTGTIGAVVTGTVVVPPGAECDLVGTTVNGNVVVEPGGGIFVVGATIDGSLVSTGASYVAVGNLGEFLGSNQISRILGNVVITGTTGTPGFPTTNVLCDATFVGGNVAITANKAPVVIGTFPGNCFYPGTGPAGDTINGSVSVTSNSAPVVLNNNLIGKDLTCRGNQPAPSGAGNVVDGSATGQCKAFSGPTG
jgi:hypothetical protein